MAGKVSIAATLEERSPNGALNGLVELVTWVPVTERLPDADLTVNIALELSGNVGVADFDGEPTFLGYWDGERWLDTSGTTVNVTHWADMLRGPVEGGRSTAAHALRGDGHG